MKDDASLQAHFESYLLAQKRVSNNTFLAYKKDVEQLREFLMSKNSSLALCTDALLRRYIARLKRAGFGARTIARKISTIKLLYTYLNKNFEIQDCAGQLIFPKLEKRLPVYLTDSEVESLLAVAARGGSPRHLRNKMIIYLLYASGMRVSELVNLTIDQIRFDTGFLQFTGKGDKERSIPLPDNIMSMLSSYLDTVRPEFLRKGLVDRSNYVFVSQSRSGQVRPLTRQTVWNVLKEMIIGAGIKKNISPHSLRHSIATHLLKNGANLRSLQMLLGHEQLTTVQIYTHLETSQLRKIYDDKHPRS